MALSPPSNDRRVNDEAGWYTSCGGRGIWLESKSKAFGIHVVRVGILRINYLADRHKPKSEEKHAKLMDDMRIDNEAIFIMSTSTIPRHRDSA